MDITSVFVALLAGNRGPVPGQPTARRPPNYRVAASLCDDLIELSLTFISGSAYCCCEPGCHLALTSAGRADRLRRALAEQGIQPPGKLVLRTTLVVEAGALFFDLSRPESSSSGRGWYAFTPSDAKWFTVTIEES